MRVCVGCGGEARPRHPNGGAYPIRCEPCHTEHRRLSARSRTSAYRNRHVLPRPTPEANKVRYERARENPENVARDRRKSRAWRQANPREAHGHYLHHRYGITRDDFDRMSESQGHACAICRQPFPAWPNRTREPHVDHDHATGQVRGLLCKQCNVALGWVDRPGWVAAAQVYLQAALTGASDVPSVVQTIRGEAS